MKRLLAKFFTVLFLFGGFAVADPLAAHAGDWACVAVYPVDVGVCVGSPFYY